MLDAPIPCHRLHPRGQPDGMQLRILDERDGGLARVRRLRRGPPRYGDLKRNLEPRQLTLLRKMLLILEQLFYTVMHMMEAPTLFFRPDIVLQVVAELGQAPRAAA